MTRVLLVIGLLLLFGVIALVAGCSSDSNPASESQTGTIAIESVTPADGSTGVSLSSPITIRFSGPVDTSSVMTNFHFAGGRPMHAWSDSLGHYGGFGMMGMHDSDQMMEWIDSIHIAGEFHWNDMLDSCEFIPDSLEPGTDYLCLLYEGGMYGRHGGIIGGMHHGDSGYHMFEFSTGGGGFSAPELLSTMPMNGAMNVGTSTQIMMAFNEPMDTLSVMDGFYFCGGDEMHEWLDSLEHHRGMGGMGMVDMGHMMEWLGDIEMPGDFDWNVDMDTCWFYPDSTLMPNEDYMIYMNGDLEDMHGGMMNMHGLDYGGYMIRFTTGP